MSDPDTTSASSAGQLADQPARDRIRVDLGTTFVVEAAAGTGKTTELIHRIVALLTTGTTTLDRIVAVTFTEKAAGEMKLRLRGELERARQAAGTTGPSSDLAAERVHLERALSELEAAHINTIHGFCADLLRERPIEAGVDPAFEVLDDASTDQLLGEAFDGWFQHVLDDPPEGVRRALRRRGWRSERSSPREQLLRACRGMLEHRDFEARYSRPTYDRQSAIDGLIECFRALGALTARARDATDSLTRSMQAFAEFVASIDEPERVRPRDYDGLEAELTRFSSDYCWGWKGRQRKEFGIGIDRQTVVDERDRARAALDSFLALAEADLAACLQTELGQVVRAREELKQKKGGLDYLDLLLCTRNLLRSDGGVRAELQHRFSHLFVDEFQDTDPLQAEILILLSASEPAASDYLCVHPEPGKLFIVGDPKQSIYRFRRADVAYYARIKSHLLERGAELLHLTTNFRSLPEIQTVVNSAFSRVMTGSDDGSQATYVALTPFRAANAHQPAVVALPVPAPYGGRDRVTKTAIQESYPRAVGAFVGWLLNESGWTVLERSVGASADALVPVEARHVCLLLRRMQNYGDDVTRPYVRSLEARRIPHVLVGGRSFHAREEILALRNALTAIEWPDDELSVYATLRGPMFAIADDELLAFRHAIGSSSATNDPQRGEARRAGHLNPLRPLDEEIACVHEPVASALRLLRDLHVNRNRRPIADTLESLLAATRAHAGFAIWPTGEQALANVLALLDSAHAFESRGAISFRAFVDWLDRQANRAEASEASIIEEGTDGVRIMTVHKAKGLEFPIVILCDPTAPDVSTFVPHYVDPERALWAERLCGCRPQELIDHEQHAKDQDTAEIVRLAYVAATRARDLLVVPVFGDGNDRGTEIGWVDLLRPAIYPAVASRRSPMRPASATWPLFGDDSVCRRADSPAQPVDSVAPGLHRGAAGDTPVVWWDPHLLHADVDPAGRIRQQELLVETERSDEGLTAYRRWSEQRSSAIERSSVPSIVARPMTELARQAVRLDANHAPNPPRIAIERTDVQREGRPRGPRFGTLVHAVLSVTPFDAKSPQIEGLTAVHARIVGATDDEIRAAHEAVVGALEHPLIQRAAAAQECRREVPVIHRLDDGTIAEGVVDLAFRDSGGWVVVDFKTEDEIAEEGLQVEQVRLYVRAVEAAVNAAVAGVVVAV